MNIITTPSPSALAPLAVKPTTRLKVPKPPRLLPLELVCWEGRLSCAYFNDYRVVGGKPWGGGTRAYAFDIRTEQLKDVLTRAAARGFTTVCFEVYRHSNGEHALYLDNELMLGKRDNSRSGQPRRVGSTLVMQYNAVRITEFAGAHETFRLPS